MRVPHPSLQLTLKPEVADVLADLLAAQESVIRRPKMMTISGDRMMAAAAQERDTGTYEPGRL